MPAVLRAELVAASDRLPLTAAVGWIRQVQQRLGRHEAIDDLARKSALQHHARGDREAMSAAVRLFSSKEKQVAFLRRYGEAAELKRLMLEQGLDGVAMVEAEALETLASSSKK